MLWQRAAGHLRRIRAGAVKHRPAGSVDCAGRAPIERANPVSPVVGSKRQVGEPLPAASDSEHLPTELRAAIDDALDDRVQAWDVTTAGQDPDARHGLPMMPRSARDALDAIAGTL